MSDLLHLIRRFRCWMTTGHDLRFVRNIHGDEIPFVNGAWDIRYRSWWACRRCDAMVARPGLYAEAENR